jgi:hypothetical protein
MTNLSTETGNLGQATTEAGPFRQSRRPITSIEPIVKEISNGSQIKNLLHGGVVVVDQYRINLEKRRGLPPYLITVGAKLQRRRLTAMERKAHTIAAFEIKAYYPGKEADTPRHGQAKTVRILAMKSSAFLAKPSARSK